MAQPSELVERRPEKANDNEKEMPVMTGFDVVESCPDAFRLNVEIAMEWALLGGD